MNITLPEALLEWVQRQVESGACANVHDYIVALVHRDMADRQRLQNFQEAITSGMASGNSERSIDELISEARALAGHDRYQLMEVKQAIEDSGK